MAKDDKKTLAAELKQVRAAMYAELDKALGKGAGRALADQEWEPLPRVSTGTLGGDYATGGIPMGRITEFYGIEGGGKTSLAVSTLAQIQKVHGPVAYIDAEHGGYEIEWARRLGLDTDATYTHLPETGEEAFKTAWIYLKHGVKGVVIDSVSALVTQATLKGEVGDAHVGQQARLMSQELNRIKHLVAESGAALIFINQLREKVGQQGYGPTTTTSGGRALRFYASTRVDVGRMHQIKDGDRQIGYQMKVKVVKNRGGPQYRTALIPLIADLGFDPAWEVCELGRAGGFISTSGAWYSYGEQRIGQGRLAAIEWLRQHPDVIAELRPKIAEFLETGEVFSSGSDE